MPLTRRTLALSILPCIAPAQPEIQMQHLSAPRLLELSPDAKLLRYKIGSQWWELPVAPNAKPRRIQHSASVKPANAPDGKRTASLRSERPTGPTLLMVAPNEPGATAVPISRMPVSAFQWAADSRSLWVIGTDGADEPVGRLHLDGRFQVISKAPAMRRQGGLAAASHTLAWTETDGHHFGAIWTRLPSGAVQLLSNPNPNAAQWNPGTQQVVRWRTPNGEELTGVLALPSSGGPFPLVVDPYSNWRNRFLNIPVLGNYLFVQQGFAVFFPNHRAPHGFPETAFGEAYIGTSKNRDPVDVLTTDVMSGVQELIRRGIALPDSLFLYSSSTGASSIGQLLTQTTAFRAAVAHGGVYDWLDHYQQRHPLGDETIPRFLGGRIPDTSPDLYRRISPIFHPGRIKTPLLLVIGDKDETRFRENLRFYQALRTSGSPVTLVVRPNEGHEIPTPQAAVNHVRQAIQFFRSAPRQ